MQPESLLAIVYKERYFQLMLFYADYFNAIPTNGNLHKRVLNVDGPFFKCKAEVEFIAHAL